MTAAAALGRFSSFIDDVAVAAAAIAAGLRRRRRVELVEQPDGSFRAINPATARPIDGSPLRLGDDGFAQPLSGPVRSLLAGSAADIVLAPSHFIFRPLELPRGADPFLEGVIRSQIDRLTPWRPDEAAFGWSEPVEQGSDRIAVTVAATAQTLVAPVVRALLASGARSAQASTRVEPGGPLITVFSQQSGAEKGHRRLRRGLVAGLGLTSLVFILNLGAWLAVGAEYSARMAELQRKTADQRTALLNQRDQGAAGAVRVLETRKRTNPSSVMTIEALSKTLPDDAYLTELRIEGGKIEIVGVAANAAPLIRLIEQSRRFTQATFYAPTVRRPAGGETFHIAGRIQPSFGGAE